MKEQFQQDTGFSLLEVVIATLILAMTFSVVFPILGAAPGRLVDAEERAIAVRLATTVMEREILREDWQTLPLTGEFEDWSWSLEAAPMDGDILPQSDYPLALTVSTWRTDTPDQGVIQLQRVVWVKNQ